MKQEAEGRKVTFLGCTNSSRSFQCFIYHFPVSLQNSWKCALGYNDLFLLIVTPPGCAGKVSKVQNDTGSQLEMVGVMIGSTNTEVANSCDHCCSHEMAS